MKRTTAALQRFCKGKEMHIPASTRYLTRLDRPGKSSMSPERRVCIKQLQTDSVRVNFQVIIEGKEAEATSLKFKNFLEKKLNPKVVVKTEDGVRKVHQDGESV